MTATNKSVGIVGGRSPVGRHLLDSLSGSGWTVTAFTRSAEAATNETITQPHDVGGTPPDAVAWRRLPTAPPDIAPSGGVIPHWIFVAHIWTVPDYLEFLEAHGIRTLVALSSTSRFTKTESSDGAERDLAQRLSDAEDKVLAWAGERGIACTILRPTLIYGGGNDRNISEMAAFIRRFRFFPLLGKADGRRQPIHVEDVAGACIAALAAAPTLKTAYNISGGEVLTYRAMVERVFEGLGERPRLVPVPLPLVKAGVSLIRLLPRYRHWSAGMAERMVKDMVFDHADAARDFGFHARAFRLDATDVNAPPRR